MKIGITYDLKADEPIPIGVPDDIHEEFDSPDTIEAIAAALRGLGHDVEKLGDGRELLEQLLAEPPDFVFNFAEGQGTGRCREARVPAVLEMLGIPHTGSDPLALAATLDKDCAKRVAASCKIATPKGLLIQRQEELRDLATRADLSFPVIVKPAWEGSSKGIRNNCLVENSLLELQQVVESLWHHYRQPLLVEEYIPGDELTVGVMGNDPPEIIGVMRVLPRQATERFVYSLEVKRDFRRQVRYECPAHLLPGKSEAVERAALTVYRALGCRDVARIDFRLREGIPYFLEANPLPGLNPDSSDLVIMARMLGWSYDQLIGRILQAAIDRQADFAEIYPAP
jgi:D-alanine-D-alanine ligase